MADDSGKPILDVEQIKKLLPHRAPFLFVERLTDIVPSESAVGWKAVSINEAMAQASGVLVMHSLNKVNEKHAVYFMTIEKARFRKPVTPGDMLRMPVRALRRRGPVWRFEGQAFVGDALCAEAEFSAMIHDNEG